MHQGHACQLQPAVLLSLTQATGACEPTESHTKHPQTAPAIPKLLSMLLAELHAVAGSCLLPHAHPLTCTSICLYSPPFSKSLFWVLTISFFSTITTCTCRYHFGQPGQVIAAHQQRSDAASQTSLFAPAHQPAHPFQCMHAPPRRKPPTSSMLRAVMRSMAMSSVFLRMSMFGEDSARRMSMITSCSTSLCLFFSSCVVQMGADGCGHGCEHASRSGCACRTDKTLPDRA